MKSKTNVSKVRKGFSILLILVSILGLLAAGLGVKDTLAIKTFMEGSAGGGDEGGMSAEESLKMLEDGINQINENENVYFDGVKQLEDGEAKLADGEAQLADGKAQLAQGYKDYADGKKQLADGAAQLRKGEADLAAGKKQLADNTQAYKEGKALLAKIEPIMPYVDQYIAFRDGHLKELPGFETAQEWFVAVVRPVAAKVGLTLPKDVKDFPKYIQDMVADGKAQLKMYEDGQKQVAAGEKQLAKGYKDYAAGKKQLADGAKTLSDGEAQLADGKAQLAQGYADYDDGLKQLAVFEDGNQQIKDGLKTVLALESVKGYNGKTVVPSPAETVGGADYDFLKYDKDGKVVKLHDGKAYVDTKKAMKLCKLAQQYAVDYTADVTQELVGRIVLYLVLAVASLLALIAGILGLKGKGTVLAIITAVLGVGANVFGAIKGYTGYTYRLADGSYSGHFQLAALIVFAVVAVASAVVFVLTKKKKGADDAKIEDIEQV